MTDEQKNLPALPRLLTAEQVAALFGVKLATIRKWTYLRLLPAVHLCGGRAVRYRSTVIQQLVEKWERAARQPLPGT